jgi:O-antigen/teichoic acid export membrane protein
MPIDPNDHDGVAPGSMPTSGGGMAAIRERGRRAISILMRFFLGQGALQGVQILAGLFLVRRLSVEAYAQFGLAYGFQVTMGTLMDLGLASSIVPLVGEHREDRQLVGRYVRAAKHLRDRAFWVLAPFAAVAFLAIMHRHHWNWGLQIVLLISVLVSLHSSGRVSYYSAPLFLFRRLREYYVLQTLSGLARLVAYFGCSVAGLLNSGVAAILSAVSTTASGIFIEKSANRDMDWPKDDDSSVDREVIEYVIPATPAIILAAFQSQISLILISIFGATTNIAQVAALGRLGQLFGVFMTFNIMVIEPFIARRSTERLLPTYLGFLGLTAILCIPIVLLAFALPAPFLWLLGANYEGLGSTVGWVVLAACINHLSGLMWIMNRSRKWIFWSGTIIEIALLLTVQVVFIAFVGVRTTRQAVFLTFASSFCYVVAHGYVGIYGFLKGHGSVRAAN